VAAGLGMILARRAVHCVLLLAVTVDSLATRGRASPEACRVSSSSALTPESSNRMPRRRHRSERIASTLATHPWLVAERGGEVVGFAYAGRYSQRAAYRWTVDVTIYVRGGERRAGIGRRLYPVLLGTLRGQGFRSAFAEIVLPNPGSARLHEVMGFRHVGVHQDIGYKLGRWHDIGYWRLGLSEGSAAPNEPIPFDLFRRMAAFGQLLAEGDLSAILARVPDRDPDPGDERPEGRPS